MAGSSSNDVFDVRRIRRLIELMKEHDLSEMDLRQGEQRIQLRRSGPPAAVGAGAPPVLAAGTSAPAASPPVADTPETQPASESESEHIKLIRSPMVGTFYAAPDPESSPYVKVGDHVGPDTTVCIVEAMKVINHIPAEVSGKIVTVLVENGESVEFAQPMFKVDTRG